MKNVKRILCVLCALLMVLSCYVPTIAAESATAKDSSLPVIYIRGNASTNIYDKSGKKIWPISGDLSSLIMKDKNAIMSAGMLSYTSNNWNYLANEIEKALAPSFDPLRLDNGKNTNGSYISPKAAKNDTDGHYTIDQYFFDYDARLDPWDVATSLRSYVNEVLGATGKTKVNMVSRCMGSAFMMAYLTRYKTDTKVKHAIFYSSAADGVLIEEAPFTGSITMTSKTIKDFSSGNEENSLSEIFQAMTKIFGETYSATIVNNILKNAMPTIMPRVLRATYANYPSYWALLGSDKFQESLDYIYGTTSLQKTYSGLISKVKNYDTKVRQCQNSTLSYLKTKGVNISVITKYNVEFSSIYDGYEAEGDSWIAGENQSFGATFAQHGKSLSSSYLDTVKKLGLAEYVSGDKKIDASTALFPDSTWFIKNLTHTKWATCVDSLMLAIFSKSTQATVKTFKEYPQFLNYTSNKLESIGNYGSSVSSKVSSVTLSPTVYEWNGNNKTPTVTVKTAAGTKLKKGTDYTVEYEESRAKIGKHWVKVSFKGNYKGTASQKVYFKILPGDVTNISVTNVKDKTATVTWSKVKGASAYRVYMYKSSTDTWKKLGETTGTKLAVSGLESGKTLKISVRAVYYTDKTKSTAYYSPDFISKTINTLPAAPSVKATAGKKQITLSWAGVTGASKYEVYRSTSKSGVYRRIASTTSKSYKNTGLTTNKIYYYKVKAIRTYDGKTYNGAYSSAVNATAK